MRGDPVLGTLKPIVRSSVAESVYQSLRDKLMHGEYLPGQTLGLQAVAHALGTSTMPVREAFRRLVVQQGLQPMINGSTCVPLITRERLDDIRRARMLIEGTVTEWAAPRLVAGQLDTLAQLAGEISVLRRSPEGAPASLEKNRVFHFTIYAAAGSPVMMAIIESLWLQSGPYLRATREFLHDRERPADRLHEHTIEAIRAGDFSKARKLIETDVCWVFDRLNEAPASVAVYESSQVGAP
jgi:DNA-binding GntR family transcriptional regulator